MRPRSSEYAGFFVGSGYKAGEAGRPKFSSLVPLGNGTNSS